MRGIRMRHRPSRLVVAAALAVVAGSLGAGLSGPVHAADPEPVTVEVPGDGIPPITVPTPTPPSLPADPPVQEPPASVPPVETPPVATTPAVTTPSDTTPPVSAPTDGVASTPEPSGTAPTSKAPAVQTPDVPFTPAQRDDDAPNTAASAGDAEPATSTSSAQAPAQGRPTVQQPSPQRAAPAGTIARRGAPPATPTDLSAPQRLQHTLERVAGCLSTPLCVDSGTAEPAGVSAGSPSSDLSPTHPGGGPRLAVLAVDAASAVASPAVAREDPEDQGHHTSLFSRSFAEAPLSLTFWAVVLATGVCVLLATVAIRSGRWAPGEVLRRRS